MTATIFGGGFGLYGYLPALIEEGKQKIVLPLRYQQKLLERSELKPYSTKIDWVSDESVALKLANTVIIALRPSDQFEWVTKSLKQANVNYLLLEKPLAESPERAKELFNQLLNSKMTFRIGYIFRHTAWSKQLSLHLAKNLTSGLVKIEWHFKAHHFQHNLDNWKRYTTSGGGAIRFYGIHLLALLAEIGYRHVASSQVGGSSSSDQIERWKGVFAGNSLPPCEVIIDSNSDQSFFKVEHTKVFADLKDPFELRNEAKTSTLDKRVPLLRDACQAVQEDSTIEYKWYEATLDLWSSVEEKQIWDLHDSL